MLNKGIKSNPYLLYFLSLNHYDNEYKYTAPCHKVALYFVTPVE